MGTSMVSRDSPLNQGIVWWAPVLPPSSWQETPAKLSSSRAKRRRAWRLWLGNPRKVEVKIAVWTTSWWVFREWSHWMYIQIMRAEDRQLSVVVLGMVLSHCLHPLDGCPLGTMVILRFPNHMRLVNGGWFKSPKFLYGELSSWEDHRTKRIATATQTLDDTGGSSEIWWFP